MRSRSGRSPRCDDLQRGDQFALEQGAAAAVMRERRQRADHRQLAHVARAVVAFHGPDRHQQFPGHAEAPFDAVEQRGVPLHQPAGASEARGGHARRRELLETALAAEGVGLTAVEGEHLAVDRQAVKAARNDVAAHARGHGVARYSRKEALERAAALRGSRGRRDQQRDKDACKPAGHAPGPLGVECRDEEASILLDTLHMETAAASGRPLTPARSGWR